MAIGHLNNENERRFQDYILANVQYWRDVVADRTTTSTELDQAQQRIVTAIQYALEYQPAWADVAALIANFTPHMERRGYWDMRHHILTRAIAVAKTHYDQQQAVEFSLLLWHRASRQNQQTNAIHPSRAMKLLLRQIQPMNDDVAWTTNDILLKLVNELEVEHPQLGKIVRLRFLGQLTASEVANRLNLAEGTVYKYQKQAMVRLKEMLAQWEQQPQTNGFAALEQRLHLPQEVELFGVQRILNNLLSMLAEPGPPWLMSLEGIGGIGKTTLANALLRQVPLTYSFQAVGWVSAQRAFFSPLQGVQADDKAALDIHSLVDQLLNQLHPQPPPVTAPEAKLAALKELLESGPFFIVIDSLETMADYEALLPILRDVVNPNRILLTSRVSLNGQDDVHTTTLSALSKADTLNFLRHEAKIHHLPKLAEVAADQLARIYAVVGGNPLALKLVVGQLHRLPLSQVLENLQLAQGKAVDALYTYIYWQAWHSLDEISQQILLTMPLAQDGDLKQLAAVTKLEIPPLRQALQQLTHHNLIGVDGGLEESRYYIHHLTETFLLNEVARWQTGT
ncbi:MAG: NB-ARC domain-containing protein [Chloroflexota bacterium]